MNTFIQLNEWIMVLTLCTARFMACYTAFGPLGPPVVTGVARNVLVLTFAVGMYPNLWQEFQAHPVSGLFVLMLLFKEVFIGLFIGFFCSLIFEIIQCIGSLVDTQRGSSMSSVFDPTLGDQTSVLGALLQRLFVVLFFAGGFFLVFLTGFYESFQLWPILSFDPWIHPLFGPLMLREMDSFMRLILLWSAPMLVVMVLVDVGFGLINRFAPQLNVFFLSMPVKSAGALFMLMSLIWLYQDIILRSKFQLTHTFQLIKTMIHP